jgi:hypothetical protein
MLDYMGKGFDSIKKAPHLSSKTSTGPKLWRCPTFPGEPSIMSAEELNDRVRDGNGCDLFAIITRSQRNELSQIK